MGSSSSSPAAAPDEEEVVLVLRAESPWAYGDHPLGWIDCGGQFRTTDPREVAIGRLLTDCCSHWRRAAEDDVYRWFEPPLGFGFGGVADFEDDDGLTVPLDAVTGRTARVLFGLREAAGGERLVTVECDGDGWPDAFVQYYLVPAAVREPHLSRSEDGDAAPPPPSPRTTDLWGHIARYLDILRSHGVSPAVTDALAAVRQSGRQPPRECPNADDLRRRYCGLPATTGADATFFDCNVCFQTLPATARVLLQPCGHNGTCEGCVSRLQASKPDGLWSCPLCRANVECFVHNCPVSSEEGYVQAADRRR